MPVFTVHAPAAVDTRPIGAADQFVFVRDGFHFWAFLLGPVWLAYHRLWLVLTGHVLLLAAVSFGLSWLEAGAGTRLAVMFLIALLLGLEVASLRRWTLSRRGWRQLDIIVAEDGETAERRFFDRWTAQHPQRGQPAVERGAPPPPRVAMPNPQPSNDIVGLFPRPGASR